MALNIIWVGNPFFQDELRALGHAVSYVPVKNAEIFLWDDLVAKSGMEKPDAVIVADKSRVPFVLGMESFPCLTAFYCVDSHVHSWYPRYAQGFDLCLVSLKDHLPLFHAPAFQQAALTPEQIFWYPPYLIGEAAEHETASAAFKEWPLLFVGTNDPELTPERHAFLQSLGERLPDLCCSRGNYRELYPEGTVILNHCVNNDLNFRVFEALGCGCCLLTPRIGHGLEELFIDGQDLFLYEANNPQAAADMARALLAEPQRRVDAATSGLQKVKAAHLARHRAIRLAEQLESMLRAGEGERLIRQRLSRSRTIWSEHLRIIYLLLAKNIEIGTMRDAYLAAGSRSG